LAAIVLTGVTTRLIVSRAGDGDHVDARAVLRDADGHEVGTATFHQRDNGKVLVHAIVQFPDDSVPAGFHGFHVHASGSCVPPDFTSAGGHYNPAGKSHAEHAGDQPSLLVAEDRTGELSFETDRYTVQDLLAGAGTALIIHRDPDNFAHIPSRYSSGGVAGPDATTRATGDAGARLACGVIIAP
jgi:Cu-Zn family superoxide dismutase